MAETQVSIRIDLNGTQTSASDCDETLRLALEVVEQHTPTSAKIWRALLLCAPS
jgi:hypothetical protein